MSGLVGWVDFRRDLELQENIVRRMTSTLYRRGPEAERLWTSRNATIGHCKLSIVNTRADKQPIVAETGEGRVTLAYTGEIYNVAELKREIQSLDGTETFCSD